MYLYLKKIIAIGITAFATAESSEIPAILLSAIDRLPIKNSYEWSQEIRTTNNRVRIADINGFKKENRFFGLQFSQKENSLRVLMEGDRWSMEEKGIWKSSAEIPDPLSTELMDLLQADIPEKALLKAVKNATEWTENPHQRYRALLKESYCIEWSRQKMNHHLPRMGSITPKISAASGFIEIILNQDSVVQYNTHITQNVEGPFGTKSIKIESKVIVKNPIVSTEFVPEAGKNSLKKISDPKDGNTSIQDHEVKQKIPGILSDISFKAENVYHFSSEPEFRNSKNKTDSSQLDLEVKKVFHLKNNLMIPLRIGSTHLFQDEHSPIPIEDQFHNLSLQTGLGRRINDQWMIMGQIEGTLYKLKEIESNDIGLSGGIMTLWNYRPHLKYIFGLMISPDSDLPVLPMIGMNWEISPHWTLQLMMPKPRIFYQFDPSLKFHFGGEMKTMNFRTSNDLGNTIGDRRYNDAFGVYRDIRLGIGLEYEINPIWNINVDTGYSVYRTIEYTRIDETVKYQPTPYLQVGIKASF